jgi:release factor glutamine methyltransferase
MGAALAMPTVRAALATATARLAAAGVPEAGADAAVLLAHVLGTTRVGLVVDAGCAVEAGAAARFDQLVARRAARVPLQHLTRQREFWSMPFAVDPRVLVPRPETEVLVETAARLAPRARRVLDVGTGSGCIAVALARELPAATIIAADVSAAALAVGRANAQRLAPGVRLVQADLVAAFRDAAFDLVVANPPYVADGELDGLAPEVRDHEPRLALAGGADGLVVLRRLLADAGRVLVPGGWLAMEMGSGQSGRLWALVAADRRWGRPEIVRDLAGLERVLAVARADGADGRRRTWTRS